MKKLWLFGLGMAVLLVICNAILAVEGVENVVVSSSAPEVEVTLESEPAEEPFLVNWYQYAWCDPSNGGTRLSGTNPNGNYGAIYFNGAGAERPSWLGRYTWIVRSVNGYVEYGQLDFRNYNRMDSLKIRERVRGTSSGGRSGTWWFVDANGRWRWNSTDTLTSATWQTWVYTNRAPFTGGTWNPNSANNYFRIGLQSSSTTVMCVDSLKLFVYGATWSGVEEGEQAKKEMAGLRVRVEPNPFSGLTRLMISSEKDRSAKVAFFDVRGSLVSSQEMPTNQAVSWNSKKLPAGVYFLRASAGEFTATEKVVITR